MPTPEEEIIAEKTRLGINEEILLQLSNEEFAESIEPQFGITRKKVIALKLLSYNVNLKKSTPIERKIIQDFLKSVRGDMEFNRELKQLASMSLFGTGINGGLLGSLITYTYKTRHLDNFYKAFGKLKHIHKRILNGLHINEQNKITLAEYSNIYDISKMKPIMEYFFQIGLFEGDDELTEFYNQTCDSALIIEKMEQDYRANHLDNPGNIVFDNTKKKSLILGKCLSFFENLIRKLITKHGHASKIYTNNTTTISHINPGPIEGDFSMRDYLYSDIYQIDISTLIPVKQKSKLELAFGRNWQEVINGIYKDIEREIHDGTVRKFSSLSASPTSEQYKTGLASLMPFGLGHKQFSKNDFHKIHEQVFGTFYRQGHHHLLCSEFVAHTTIAALVELNNRLTTKLSEKGIVAEPGEIVKIPIGKHENLHRMHPDRLLAVLKKTNCIRKVAINPAIAKYFKNARPNSFRGFAKYRSHFSRSLTSKTPSSDKPSNSI